MKSNFFKRNLMKFGLAATLLYPAEAAPKERMNDEESPDKIETFQNNPISKPGGKPESYAQPEELNDHAWRLSDYQIKENMEETIRSSESDLLIGKLSRLDGKLEQSLKAYLRAETNLKSFGEDETDPEIKKELEKNYEEKKIIYQKLDQEAASLEKRFADIQAGLIPKDLEEVVANAPKMFQTVQEAKRKASLIISTNEYLNKLKEEFSCSDEEALKHQRVRLDNIIRTPFYFEPQERLEDTGAKAFYSDNEFWGKNGVTLPYNNVDLETLEELAIHEFLHAATRGERGLSPKSKQKLSESFMPNKSIDSPDLASYHQKATERYVRLKMLEQELDRLGIKKLGERFTEEHFNKMMNIFNSQEENDYPSDKFNKNAKEFLDYTPQEYNTYDQLFNEIASQENNADELKSNSNYRHPGWDYDNPENLA